MARKVRKQIYIDARQEKWLKSLTKRTGVPEAEIIRRAIDRHAPEVVLSIKNPRAAWEIERQRIQKLIATGNAEPRPRAWTREDAYDRY